MNPVSHIEIGTGDAKPEAEFFQALFGWPWQRMGDAGEGWFDLGSIRIGIHGKDDDPAIAMFFTVLDIDLAAETVRRLGGMAELPAAEEPGFGRFVNCKTAQGVRFGLHQRPQ